jgi:hypothetical protein
MGLSRQDLWMRSVLRLELDVFLEATAKVLVSVKLQVFTLAKLLEDDIVRKTMDILWAAALQVFTDIEDRVLAAGSSL